MSTGLSSADETLSWRHGPGPQLLLPSEIHVWRIRRPGADVRRACRALLLELLGRYAGLDPGQVRLRRGLFGKPEMDPGTIQFNLSHSGETGLVALAAERCVGVDVEEIRGDAQVDRLAAGFFTSGERDLLRGHEGEARTRAFYLAWVRKEAGIKARGGSVTQANAHAHADAHADADAEGRWHVQDLPMGEKCAAALCCDGPPGRLYLWDWEQENA